MAKKIIFLAGSAPGKKPRLSNKEMAPAHNAGGKLTLVCHSEPVMALITDTLAPRRTLGVMKQMLNVVGVVESSALNYSPDPVNKLKEDQFLDLLTQHEEKEEILLICTPTELLKYVIAAWCRWNFIQVGELNISEFGQIFIADVDTRTLTAL